MSDPVIAAVSGTPTHDGEDAVVITISFPSGGYTDIQISGEDAQEVVRRAGVSSPDDLLGAHWKVLQIRETSFTG